MRSRQTAIQKPSRRASPHSIPATSGAAGSSNPTRTREGERESSGTSATTGGGVLESATATPTVAAITITSTAATRTKSLRDASDTSEGSTRRRCQRPNPESTTIKATLIRTRRPYHVVTSSAGLARRTEALTTPLIATATAHQSARALKRGTATGSALRSTIPSSTSAVIPPHHSERESTCTMRLETATEWSAEAPECPLRVGGMSAERARSPTSPAPVVLRTA